MATPSETCLVVRVRPCVSPFASDNPRVALVLACVVVAAPTACLDDRSLRAAPVFGPPLDASGVLEADIPSDGNVEADGAAGQANSGGGPNTGGRPSSHTGG